MLSPMEAEDLTEEGFDPQPVVKVELSTGKT
jgi:hypothetical protein